LATPAGLGHVAAFLLESVLFSSPSSQRILLGHTDSGLGVRAVAEWLPNV
jgi:hypothetical protein